MLGCKMKAVSMARITQEGSPLHTPAQVLGHKGNLAPLRHEAADIEAPVGIEGIHDPIVTLHGRQLLDDIGEMGGKISTGACLTEMPYDLTCWHHKRGDQYPRPMTDVLVFAFFR